MKYQRTSLFVRGVMLVVVSESSSGHLSYGRVPDVGSAIERKANGERRRTQAGKPRAHRREYNGSAQGERQEHRHRGRTLSDEEVEGEGAVIPKLHWIKKTTLQSFI